MQISKHEPDQLELDCNKVLDGLKHLPDTESKIDVIEECRNYLLHELSEGFESRLGKAGQELCEFLKQETTEFNVGILAPDTLLVFEHKSDCTKKITKNMTEFKGYKVEVEYTGKPKLIVR